MSVGSGIHAKQGVDFLGLPEMQKQFAALTGSLQRKVLRQAVNAGATALTAAVRKVTPKLTGTLKKSLKKKPSSQWRGGKSAAAKGIIGVTVGYDLSKAPHANLVAWSVMSSEGAKAQNYFNQAAKGASSTIRAKITAKAKQALPKAIAQGAK